MDVRFAQAVIRSHKGYINPHMMLTWQSLIMNIYEISSKMHILSHQKDTEKVK